MQDADRVLDRETFWRLVLAICAQVDPADVDAGGFLEVDIGAGPLEDFIRKFRHEAMDLIEPELSRNRTLLESLGGVWVERGDNELLARLDAALAANGSRRY